MPKVLVIEDQPFVRANILEMLEAEDFEVVSAENGFVGALWALEHVPDLVICDVMMPEANGYEVLSALRQSPITASIPFIFLTAMADKVDVRYGMNLGADDYLTKPFTRLELLEAVSSRFSRQGSIAQQYASEQKPVKTLQEKAQDLQQLHLAVSRINVIIHLLKNMQPMPSQERCSEILREVCSDEIALLNQSPILENILPTGNLEFLQQLNLV
jgi:CheY-like chemotaxis protein